ncbi:MAG TPA: dTDP-4-dehydrorhamnose 3,5-epimerase family protein [Acidimicrobiia bacterium]|nr:dTDP-4-dehydrorhamnose 3,5-epimerase family protein [Acidimicrobiia bacterium]
MEVSETSLHGVRLIRPEPRPDDRGWFLRVFDADLYSAAGIDHTRYVQENQSRSRHRTIRGLHTRSNLTEAKLIRCARGAVFDVVVDLRPWSPSFLQWESFHLDDEAHLQLSVPPGCAHGFQALSDWADLCYRVDSPYDAALDVAVSYRDPELAIPWPLDDPVVSERDLAAPALADLRPQFETWYGTSPPT